MAKNTNTNTNAFLVALAAIEQAGASADNAIVRAASLIPDTLPSVIRVEDGDALLAELSPADALAKGRKDKLTRDAVRASLMALIPERPKDAAKSHDRSVVAAAAEFKAREANIRRALHIALIVAECGGKWMGDTASIETAHVVKGLEAIGLLRDTIRGNPSRVVIGKSPQDRILYIASKGDRTISARISYATLAKAFPLLGGTTGKRGKGTVVHWDDAFKAMRTLLTTATDVALTDKQVEDVTVLITLAQQRLGIVPVSENKPTAKRMRKAKAA